MRTLLPLMRQQVGDALRGDRGWLIGAGTGAVLIVVLTLFKIAFVGAIGYPTPFLLYFGAIMVATYKGGVFAGQATTILCAVASYFLFMDKTAGAFFFEGATALVAFLVEGTCIALVTGGFVAQRRMATRALEEAKQVSAQLQVVLSGVGEGITLQDSTGRTLYANQVAAEMAGYASPEEFVRAAPNELMQRFEFFDTAGNPFPRNEVPGRRILRGLPAPQVKIRVRRVDTGKEHWALLRANAIYDDDGEIAHVVSVFRDVTGAQEKDAELKLAREWFQIALRSIGDAIITTDARGRVNLLNPIAEELTGWKVEEALGRRLDEVLQLVTVDTREPLENPVSRVIREGGVAALSDKTLLIRRDGSEIAIDDSAAPIRGTDGGLEGVILVFRDVSAKRLEESRVAFLARATQELNSSLDYKRTLSTVAKLAVPAIADWCAVDILEGEDVVRVGVAHVDEEKVRKVDELQRRYPADPEAPRGLHHILRTGEAQLMPEIPLELLQQSARSEEHLRLILELGLHSYMGVPLKRDGKTFGVITFATAESKRTFGERDIALAHALADRAALAVENAALFRAAEHARQQAETANRTKDEFLAMLGHELRNPLAPISSALELLKNKYGDQEQHREVEVIERQVEHLVRLVDDLLDVARITKGRLELNRRCVSVAEIVERAREMAWPESKTPLHQVHVRIQPGLELNCDPVRASQIIANLLINSMKYTPPGGNIWIDAEKTGESASIRVADDGMGIAKETLTQVFELFVQEPQALDRARGGLGLGLAIVKGLVSAHGGTVSATSAGLGRGAAFTVLLPIGDVSAAGEPLSASRELKPHSERRILIVDDNVDAAELLAELLRLSGHEVRIAHDGPKALNLVKDWIPDVALLDIGLPGMTGYELAARLREIEELRHIDLIAATGYGRPDDHKRSEEAKFLAHLVKPIDIRALEQVLQSSGSGTASREHSA